MSSGIHRDNITKTSPKVISSLLSLHSSLLIFLPRYIDVNMVNTIGLNIHEIKTESCPNRDSRQKLLIPGSSLMIKLTTSQTELHPGKYYQIRKAKKQNWGILPKYSLEFFPTGVAKLRIRHPTSANPSM